MTRFRLKSGLSAFGSALIRDQYPRRILMDLQKRHSDVKIRKAVWRPKDPLDTAGGKESLETTPPPKVGLAKQLQLLAIATESQQNDK